MSLPGVQEDWIQWRVHGSDHVVHPVRRKSSLAGDSNVVNCMWSCSFVLPRADAFGHSDNVTQAGWCFDLCPWTHRHGNQLFSQSVADLNVVGHFVESITQTFFIDNWYFTIHNDVCKSFLHGAWRLLFAVNMFCKSAQRSVPLLS